MIGIGKDDRLLSLRDVSSRTGVKVSTLRRWRLLRKHLPFVSVGRGVRVPASALEEFIKRNVAPPTRE